MGPIRILIIEDDVDIIDLLRSILEPQFECFTAANGMEGLQQAIRGEPDVVICDIMMPLMDGWEFIKRLRGMKGYEWMPVIFLSALTSREHIQQGYQLGAALYVTKPIDPPRFKRLLELFIKDHDIQEKPKRLSIERVRALSVFPQVGTPADANKTPAPNHPATATPPPPPHASTAPRAAAATPRPPQATPRVLVVEDDADSRQLVYTALKDDCEILEAADGVSAIDYAVRYKPDLFIIDGMLPRLTGYQLTVMLKKNREFYKSPIIFISGKATPRDREYVDKLGVVNFLAKPFSGVQIKRVVEEIIKKPDFVIHTDRLDSNQIQLEQFHQVETQRGKTPAIRMQQPEQRPPLDKL
ncbi:response regulator [bacterium]|nr:response regulator [bacterium]